MASAKSSLSRPAGHSGVFPVGSVGGGGGGGDGGVQLADKLKIFKTDNFDPDAYVQSKCQTMNEKGDEPIVENDDDEDDDKDEEDDDAEEALKVQLIPRGGWPAHQIRDQRAGDPEMRFSREELVGSAFIAFGVTFFVAFFYSAIVSKLLPPYENCLLAAIQNDWYYSLLVPLTLPVIIVAVYLHWLSMKMFKHA